MAEKKPQTFANHARFDPLFHFFVVPVFALALILAIVHFVGHVSEGGLHRQVHSVALIIFAAALLVMALKTRMYALRVQDRIIRLEERLRLALLLPEALRSRIPELTEGQLIGLRFCSDAEVAKLTERTLNEKLSRSDIKKGVQTWRPDYWRV